MKKMTLKWRVTLWYASMLFILVLFVFSFVLSVSDQLLRSESASALEDEVWDFIEEVDVQNGVLNLREDIRFYQNSVVFSLYDGQGRLAAGSVPKDFPENTTLRAYTIQKFQNTKGEWTGYDAAIPDGTGGYFWVRGVCAEDTLTTVEETVQRLLLIACPLLILAALVVGYLITRRALQPIEDIRRTADEIGSGSDLSLRIPVERTQGEVRQLADTFNHMFARLEQSFEKERQFTSDASHELRTPLSVIRSQAEYALLPDMEEDELREGMEVIREQSERMSELLSQLLLLARADNGREQLKKEPVDLSALVQEALEEARKKADVRQITLQSVIEPELAVTGDRDSLVRVFRNLLENAVQYGRDGGYVRVSAFRDGDQIICKIEDNGIGIAPEHLDRIWNRFYRVDTVRGAANGNSGLGLSIVKWAVEEHGGMILAESEPGKGSCFIVSLPEISHGKIT